jgi:hypothetical protein
LLPQFLSKKEFDEAGRRFKVRLSGRQMGKSFKGGKTKSGQRVQEQQQQQQLVRGDGTEAGGWQFSGT